MKNKKSNLKTNPEASILLLLFFAVGFAEVLSEIYKNSFFIYFLKPSLLPILAFIYYKTSKIRNIYYFVALFFGILANIFFISRTFESIIIGSLFHVFYRILIIYIVIKTLGIKNFLPLFIGSIPFVVVFSYAAVLTMDELGEALYIFIIQSLFMSFLGGYSISYHVIENNKTSFWLLISNVLFAVIQFLFVIRMYYLSIDIFQPILMLLFIIAHFAFYKFMLHSEKLYSDFLSSRT